VCNVWTIDAASMIDQYPQEAINRGYSNANELANDNDLNNLRGNAVFESLLTGLRLKIATTQPKLDALVVWIPSPALKQLPTSGRLYKA
jgi:hypothetical protein